jgi:serine/threonine-protein kinase
MVPPTNARYNPRNPATQLLLAPGTRLGPYEIISPLGAGGMGEVYRARDTKLNRDVALKILPAEFAVDPDRLARFKREAQVLASLNHPHIAAIYGFEDSGETHALVLELVEGPTLADRIAKGPIPLDEALPIAKQVAEALEAAHEQGIIHRDLKPSNVKVTSDGVVKVLDFGLAKLADPAAASGQNLSVTASPTITTPAMMTGVGIILGTAAYMSPEQAKGRPADKRSDIWAFGCVLYEMLTGTRVFAGEDVSDTLAAVLRGAPDWSALPRGTPATVRTLLKGCLEKDRKARFADVAVIQFLLQNAHSVDEGEVTSRRRPTWWLAVAAAVLLAAVSAMIAWTVAGSRAEPPRLTRLIMPWPASETADTITQFQVSPDGRRIAYVASRAGVLSSGQLVMQSFDRLDSEIVREAPLARAPFWSPDGKWIAFFQSIGGVGQGSSAGTELRKVPVAGGPSVVICRLRAPTGWPVAASWGSNDTIVFTAAQEGGVGPALFRVSANGGEAVALTKTDPGRGEAGHVFPMLLPGGHAALYSIAVTSTPTAQGARYENAQTAIIDLDTGQHHVILPRGARATYLPTGQVVYFAAGSLMAARFDLQQKALVGEPVPVIEHVRAALAGPEFSVATDGTLAYVAGGTTATGAARSLTWVDRKGKQDPIPAPPRAYTNPRLSPNGFQIATDTRDQNQDVWIWDVARRTLRQLTLDSANSVQPLWTPDGRRLLFASNRGNGAFNIFWQAADGTGSPERLTTSTNPQFPQAITPDGKHVVLLEQSPRTGNDLMLLTLDDKPKVEPLVQTSASEANSTLSPDGHWLAHMSAESGQSEIYVRPFPDVNAGRWRVSTNGGNRPLWARNGKELFYGALDGAMMAVPVETDRGFTWGNAVKLFDWPTLDRPGFGRTYDVSADGQRFLMIKEPEESKAVSDASASGIIIVSNWTEELKQRVPAK